jgi:hypothetical protein
MSAFPRKRLVKSGTKRFRGNAMDVAASTITIRIDALSAAIEDGRIPIWLLWFYHAVLTLLADALNTLG